MLKQLGGTRAILAYLLTGAVIGGCFILVCLTLNLRHW